MSILEELSSQFNRDGFVIARTLFSRAELDQVDGHLSRFVDDIAPSLPPGEAYFEEEGVVKSAFRLHEHDGFFDQLLYDIRITEIVSAIFDDAHLSHQGVNFFAKASQCGSETPAHQDNVFQRIEPAEGLTATLALDGSTRENGVLCCRRGSHRLGLLPHVPSNVAGFSQCLVDPLDPDAYPEVALCMEPGDVAFHHLESVHYSGANRTTHGRRQLALGYCSSRALRNEVAFAAYKEELKLSHAKQLVDGEDTD